MTFVETQNKNVLPNMFQDSPSVEQRESFASVAQPLVDFALRRPTLALGMVFSAGVMLGATLLTSVGRLATLGLVGLAIRSIVVRARDARASGEAFALA